MTKVLVTGATGFVGAHLLKCLLQEKSVDIIIRNSTDTSRIDSCLSSVSQIFRADLSDRETIFKIVKESRPDILYHAAACGALSSQTDVRAIVDANLLGTINLVDAALAYNVPCFVNTGSSSEYGPKDVPMSEQDCCEPIGMYAITKLAATNYCTSIGRRHQMRICTLRLFSPYGELEDPTRLYPSIVGSLMRGERARLSNPDYVRDFIPIAKVIDIYNEIPSLPFESGAIYNVGSGQQQTLLQFYNKIASSLGKARIKPIWGEISARRDEPQFWQADMTKLNALLGR